MESSLYFNFWIKSNDKEGNKTLIRANFNGDYTPKWFNKLESNTQEEDFMRLAELIQGMRDIQLKKGTEQTYSLKRFKAVIKALLNIMKNKDAKIEVQQSSIMVLKAIIQSSDSKGMKIRKILLDLSIVELIISQIIEY